MEHKEFEHIVQIVCECTMRLLKEDIYRAKRYKQHYTGILTYCKAEGMFLQTREDFDKISSDCTCGLDLHARQEFRKAAYMVLEYIRTGRFDWHPVPKTKHPVPTIYSNVFNDFQKELSQKLRPSSLRVATSPVKHFLCYLSDAGITDLSSLTDTAVWEFIRLVKPRYQSCLGRMFHSIKKFLSYLRMHGIVDLKAERFLIPPAKKRTKVLPCLSDTELSDIFSVIDRTSVKGMRDYTIFLIALRLGLRACDIVNLKLGDIDWQHSRICITQKKTNVTLALPLPADVGNAIARYILDARPDVNNPYLFLRLKAPETYAPLCASSFNGYLRRYMSMAGIDRKGWDGKSFHALRRTAGTSMLKTGTPLPTISQVLGHRNLESTKRYLSLDTESMRECCLDLGPLSSRKEGLR